MDTGQNLTFPQNRILFTKKEDERIFDCIYLDFQQMWSNSNTLCFGQAKMNDIMSQSK